MSNFKSRPVKIATVMRRKGFVDGVSDYRRGRPWQEIPDPKQALSYERGRQFAALFAGAIKSGNSVRMEAQIAFSKALRAKDIL